MDIIGAPKNVLNDLATGCEKQRMQILLNIFVTNFVSILSEKKKNEHTFTIGERSDQYIFDSTFINNIYKILTYNAEGDPDTTLEPKAAEFESNNTHQIVPRNKTHKTLDPKAAKFESQNIPLNANAATFFPGGTPGTSSEQLMQ
jgi:hypothetical protein